MIKTLIVVVFALKIGGIFSNEMLDYGPYLKNFPITLQTWEPTKERGNQISIQGKDDINILLHTLFPTLEGARAVKAEGRYKETLEKSEALARFIIMMRVAGLHLVTSAQQKANNKQGVIWPYSLASVFGHGQRVLVTLSNIKSENLLSFLFGNDRAHFPGFVKKRSVSSHGVKQNSDGSVEEVKMGNVFGAVKNLFKGMNGQHLYINYSWGGLGQIGPDGLLNGVSGKRYDPRTGKLDDGTKLGHLYVFHENLERGVSAVLFGVETCSPGSKNPFGVSHNIKSGMTSTKDNRAVDGGSKMQVLFSKELAPAEYGGMRVDIDSAAFEKIVKECNYYKSLKPDQQVNYMYNILVKNGNGADAYIPAVQN